MKFLQQLHTVQGRMTTGCVLLVAVVVGLWPDHSRSFDPAKAGAIITAAIAWLFAEIADVGKPRPSDVILFENIVAKFPQGVLDFLRHHDFGAAYHDPGFDGLYEVSSWKGARYEFVDKVLQRHWSKMKADISRFSSALAHNTFPESARGWFTVHTTHGDPENPEEFVQKRITLLNDMATNFANQIDSFERFARARLRL